MTYIHQTILAIRRVASRQQTPPLYRAISSFVIRRPSACATRVAPTPLVFCSAEGWAPQQHVSLSAYSSALVETGFTCIDSHFLRPVGSSVTSTSEELLELCSDELRTKLQTLGYPFPPVIFASGLASLIVQAYVSSHPAQGLFLVSPPSNTCLQNHPNILPTPVSEFKYEPHFPIAVMATSGSMATVKTQSRFTQSRWVDLIEVEDLESDQAIKEVERWVDELGI